jgi:photosystem II stability/assembly factor-like uncharacterized protein
LPKPTNMKKILFLLLLPFAAIAQDDSAFFSKVKFRSIGPYRGGRSAAVCGSAKYKQTFYFGGTGGGVWRTQDGGSNWKNISDGFFGGSIGAVALAPSDESVMYVGEGEGTMRGNVSEGFGMWKSENGGRSWKPIGLTDTRHIVKIVVHPKDPNTVWVAASGHLFGPSEQRGVYKTTDGGKTWRRVLYSGNAQAGAADLCMEPGNPNVLYAATWNVIRRAHNLESGGEGSGVWKSTDGGETWTNLMAKKGLPQKEVIGICGVTVSPVNPDKVWAIIECKSGGLYRSDDGGETWSKQSTDQEIRQRAWYYSKIFADTKNENTVYALNVGMWRSRDGGKTFQPIRTPHGDHHDLWIDPEDSQRMIVGDDGGGQVSFDAGANWSTYENQPTSQIYRVSTDSHFPYRILGAQQDNSTIRILSRTYGNAITAQDWMPTAGSESGYVVADPLNDDIVYGGNYGGYLSRYDHKSGENRAVSVWADNPLGGGADVMKYRFQWNFPIFFSPHNPKRLYACGNHLFVSENEGQSWERISPDLTTNDKARQASSGGPITKDNTGVEVYCTIFTAAESVAEKDVLWTGSDDGLVHVSRDAGKNWEQVTPKDCPKWMMWNCIETDPYKKGGAYIVGTRYKSDDFAPYIYKTEDYGKTWKLITNGINNLHFTRAMRVDPKRKGLLYAGTEYGLYISYDDGANWKKFQLNLPLVPITDMTIKENDLIVATQGRAFWVLDDLSVVQQKQNIADKSLFVFNTNDAWRVEGGVNPNARNAGANPVNGAVINYWLKNYKEGDTVIVRVMDAQKQVIKSFSTVALPGVDKDTKPEPGKGMNRFVWDMFYPKSEKIDGMILWSGGIGGAKAAPGKYFARVVTPKDSAETSFSIKADPNYKISQNDYDQQFAFLRKVQAKYDEVQKAIKDIRNVRSQLNDFMSRNDSNMTKDLKPLSDSISKQITAVEEALYQTKAKSGQDVLNFPIRLNDKIGDVYGYAESGYNAPTKQVVETFDELSKQADLQLNKLKSVMNNEVKQFNQLIHQKTIPVIGIGK